MIALMKRPAIRVTIAAALVLLAGGIDWFIRHFARSVFHP
jgi:hypothetical protein